MKTFQQFIKESTNQKSRLLELPIFRQNKDWSCGAASLKMVLKYYDIDVTEKELIKELNTDKEGTLPKNIIKYCHKIGLKTTDKNHMTINDLKSYIDKDIPIIIEFQGFKENKNIKYEDDWEDGHFSVVVGYTDDSIIYNDPAVKKQKSLSFSNFMKRWHDINRGIVDTQYGIAIYKSKNNN